MEPQNQNFGGGVAQTFLSPIVLLALLLAAILIFGFGRKKALAAFLAAAILIPVDQVLYVGALHFPVLRILAIFGFVRVAWFRLAKKERMFSGGMTGIDIAVIWGAFFVVVNGLLLWREWQEVVFQIGNLITTFGVYFLLRSLIRGREDVRQVLHVLVWISAAVAFVMGFEQATGTNLIYSTLGGARADILGSAITRDEHLRSAGTFAHPILAGTFGGILLPLFIGLWITDKKERKLATVGIAACCVIPFAASSSTALFGFLGGIMALCFWPLRTRMKVIRWSVAIVLIGLHIAMKAPVWHLVSRIDLTGSSSSYHRYQLINQCIVHFRDWVFVGTKNYADWGWDMWDLSNQYVFIADTSGLIPLVAFVVTIILAFRYVGKSRRAFVHDRKQQLFVWALGASLFANVVAFFGISYFDQTIVAWYALLAMICTVYSSARAEKKITEKTIKSDAILAPQLHEVATAER